MEARFRTPSSMIRSSPGSMRFSLVTPAVPALSANPALAYGLLCANERIASDGRSFEQMRIACVPDIGIPGRFGFQSGALDRRPPQQPSFGRAMRVPVTHEEPAP